MKTVLRLCIWCHLSVNLALLGAQEPVLAQTPGEQAARTESRSAKRGDDAPQQLDAGNRGYAGHFSCQLFSGLDRELCAAVSDGEDRDVPRLIQAGANIEARSQGKITQGMTPLIVAVRYG